MKPLRFLGGVLLSGAVGYVGGRLFGTWALVFVVPFAVAVACVCLSVSRP